MSATGKPVDLRVNVTSDGSEAAITVPADFPREYLTVPYCQEKLREYGVEIIGQVPRAIEELVKTVPAEGEAITMVVARKTPPVHGRDGRVEWTIEAEQDGHAEAAGEEKTDDESDEEGEAKAEIEGINHYETSAYIMVTNGMTLGRVFEPVVGTDGRDVTGRSLVAKVGKPISLKLDETILLKADGTLLAQSDGFFHRSGPKAKICKRLEVTGYVDFSTGNIDFKGDVLIHKGVRDCFVVKASNDIEANGLIEAATIEAGGSLNAAGGMAGRERGTVKVGRDLSGKYLDNIKGTVGGDLKIDREIINCALTIGGAIRMPNASIIGGSVCVTGSADLAEVGSSGGTPTRITVGTVPGFEQIHARIETILKKLCTKRDQIIEEQRQLHANSRFLTSTQKERATEIMFDIHQVEANVQKAETARKVMEAEIGKRRTVHVTVNRELHRGVILVIRDQQFRVDEDTRGPLQIDMDATGRPVIHRGDSVKPLATIARVSSAGSKSVA